MSRNHRNHLKWSSGEQVGGALEPSARFARRGGHARRLGSASIALLAIASVLGCAHTARRWHEPNPTSAVTSFRPSEASPGARTLLEVLQWHVPGITVTRLPNGAASLSIRDGSCRSFNTPVGTLAEANPLVIIDGMPLLDDPIRVTQELESLLPQRVERVEVLRDVASTAFYGTRGYCGVIRVSTLRGAA